MLLFVHRLFYASIFVLVSLRLQGAAKTTVSQEQLSVCRAGGFPAFLMKGLLKSGQIGE